VEGLAREDLVLSMVSTLTQPSVSRMNRQSNEHRSIDQVRKEERDQESCSQMEEEKKKVSKGRSQRSLAF
jgi:hypothetical protein